jgi:hypothetical protein
MTGLLLLQAKECQGSQVNTISQKRQERVSVRAIKVYGFADTIISDLKPPEL